MQSAEIELKFPIADAQAFQSRLPALHFHLDTPRTFEANTLYDTPGRALRDAAQILRIRQYGTLCTLTHKRHPDREDPGSRYKVRLETEAHVDDGAALAEIFRHLGYVPAFRYEKYRTEWSHDDPAAKSIGHLVVDETPIGTWGELEGPTEWIDRMLALLAIDPATCIIDSYGKLFLAWKQRTASTVNHLTFDLIPENIESFATR